MKLKILKYMIFFIWCIVENFIWWLIVFQNKNMYIVQNLLNYSLHIYKFKSIKDVIKYYAI